MKNSDSRYWLIPLLAAFAIYVPFSSIPSTPDQQSSAQPQLPALFQLVPLPTPTPELAPGRVSGEAAKLLCDFFGSKQKLDQGAQGQKRGQKQARPTGPQDFDPKNLRGDYCRVKSIPDLNRGGQPAPGKYEIEYLIATVPDPKDSRFDHLFDRYQDAIQRGIGAAGYTFDRFWLPWDRSRTAAPVVLPTDPRAPQLAMATRHLYEPGVILFRGRHESGNNSKGGERLLLLFMVGETPTGGIHKVAFQNALWQIEEIADWKRSKTEKKELRILGPFFSGSDSSLATLLKAWIYEHEYLAQLKVRIVSGSAIAAKKGLLEEIAPEKVSFQSTVIEEKQAISEFYKYLKDRDSWINRSDDGPQVALLSEAGTARGQRVREEQQNENQLQTLSLSFPLNISQLRIEAAKISLQRDEVARAKSLTSKAPDLALPMREAGSLTAKDSIPLFSPLETVTMDLTLDEALSAIRRERIHYVGVTASDVQDRIFLVSEIRKQCPNVTIFINGNDLLYLHSESNPDFQGALVISPYPLFGLNQLWTFPFAGYERRLQFSTNAAQGVYNATLALLIREEEDQTPQDRMLEYGCPLREYKDGENRYPALWLGIVGRNGIWPVKTFDIGSLKITKQSWESLESKNVPRDVLEKLRGIIGQKFNGEKPFLDKLKEVIGDDQTNKFKELFLQQARNSYTLAVKHKAMEPKTDGPRSDERKKLQLGLSGNYWSPTGLGILLLIGSVCLFLSLVCMTQSILFWGRNKDPNQLGEGLFRLSRPIIELSHELEREIEDKNVRVSLRPLAWIRRGWPGQVFGDEEFYRYHRDRHINMMSCCFSLVTITLFISSVAMLPAWVRCEMAEGEAFTSRWYPALCVIVGMILALAPALVCWLAVSVTRRHFRRRIEVVWRIGVALSLFLVAAMITFVFSRDQDLGLGVIAVMILMLSLAVLCWLAYRPAVSVIKWMIGERRYFGERIEAAPDERPLPTLASRMRRYFRERIGAAMALGVGAAMVTFVALGLIEIYRAKTLEQIPEQIFFFLRATELASGVSVLLPALLIGLAAFLPFFAALRRLDLAERMPCLPGPQECPDYAKQFLHFDHDKAKSFKGLKILEDRVKEMIVCRNAPGVAPAVVVILILYWILFLHYFIPSVDGRWFDYYFKLVFFVAPLLLAWAFLRFVWLWAALRRLLRRLSWHPLISQYAAKHSEEKRFASLPRVDLMAPTPTYTALSASARQARSFYNALKFPPERAETGEQIRELVEDAERKLSDALDFEAKGAWQDALKNRRGAEEALADLTEHVTGLLEDSWRTSGGAGSDVGWRDKGKFFLITHIIAFLQHIFAHLQNLVMLVTAGLLLLLLATTSYPFRPRESLLLFSWVAILTSVVVTLFIFVQESGDKTLSLLNGRTPGKLNITRDFVMRVLFHGVVPLIALLGAQFPEAVRKIFSWLSVFEGKGG